MSLSTKLAFPVLFLGSGVSAFASEGGVSSKAEILFHVGPLPVTNSMVAAWSIALYLVIVIRAATWKPRLIPTRSQAIVESLVQGVLDLITPIVGPRVARPAFPFLVGLFTYILIQNWSGLLPGVGTIKVLEHGQWMELIRPGNADMNSTVALAAVSMACWLYFVLRYAGPRALLYDLFGNKADRREIPGVIYYLLFVIFFGVGLIECVSIMFRPVSLSFRLFGNMLGGENLIHAMYGLQKWLLPTPFYFLEILVGFVQALVFTLLVAVYIGLICNHGDEAGHAAPGGAAAPH
jgi:F-type H+-transporting ATPase subunit a